LRVIGEGEGGAQRFEQESLRGKDTGPEVLKRVTGQRRGTGPNLGI